MNIRVIDSLDPECIAMIQAFYSRNHMSIDERLPVGESYHAETIKRSLNKFYIGYGHHSIGDCGATTIFIEGVSLLAAKVIQDTPLYNGQESSTRYIDFKSQGWVSVNPEYDRINQMLIDFYYNSKGVLKDHLTLKYMDDKNHPDFEKTIDVKCFDILRGFLPAGVKTQLSWFTTLSHAYDRLVILANHPLEEVANIAINIATRLKEKYPSSFSNIFDKIAKHKKFYEENSEIFYYETKMYKVRNQPTFYMKRINSTNDSINYIKRKPGDPIPNMLKMYDDYSIHYKLAFAELRDILRHRGCFQPLPLLTTEIGFAKWYLQQLPCTLKKEAQVIINTISDTIKSNKYNDQYYIPIGFECEALIKTSLPQLIYMIELRTGKSVHPNLRHLMQKIAKRLNTYLIGHDITDFSYDDEEVGLNLKRAKEDIILK
jgi:thymidylate synthase ThyX